MPPTPDPMADPLAEAQARVAALRAQLQATQAQPVRLIETHISWVLLTDTLAYKFKKPLRLPFADFSSLDARRRFCEEELRLNRRLAASVYLGVVEVWDGPGGPRFGAGGVVCDVAVKMRRFADGALWSERVAAGTLGAAEVDQLAARLAAFHREAAVAGPHSGFGSQAIHQRVSQRLAEGIEAWQQQARSPEPAWLAVRDWLLAQPARLAPLFDARLRQGHVREGHGDLHLANLLQLGDEATAFDGIDFDPALRWIDVLDDIAFVVMDLMAHGAPALAFRFLNAYLDATGEHGGLPAMRFFLVGRALVRAQVAALVEAQGRATVGPGVAGYLRLAQGLVASAEGGEARLAITHGLPGSGKSFVSQRLLESTGAVRVRSDVERKRLFGLSALQSSQNLVQREGQAGIYDSASTARTYARLHALARTALEAGWPVIVDAAFLRAAERDDFAALAHTLGVPFSILNCQAPVPVLQQRLLHRQALGNDPSEADGEVLARLQTAAEPLSEAERAVAITFDAPHPRVPGEASTQAGAAQP